VVTSKSLDTESSGVTFEQPKNIYLFFTFGNIFACTVLTGLSYGISHTILFSLISPMLYIYTYMTYLKIRNNLTIDSKYHIIGIVSLFIVVQELYITKDYFRVLFVPVLVSVLIAFLFSYDLVIFDYTIGLTYEAEREELTIEHNKLWIQYEEKYHIPHEAHLKLVQSHFQMGIYSKSNAYHKIQFNDYNGYTRSVDVAPVFVSGFDLINSLYHVLQPRSLVLTELSDIRPKFIFSGFQNGVLSLPNTRTPAGYMSMDEFLEDDSKKKSVFPQSNTHSSLAPAIVVGLIALLVLLYSNLLQLPTGQNLITTEVNRVLFLIGFTIVDLLMIYILGTSYLTVLFGNLEIISHAMNYEFRYQTKWLRPVRIEIAKEFHPVVKIEDNEYTMIIFNDSGGIFYKQRLFAQE